MNTRTQYMSANITLPPQERFLSAQHIHIDTHIAKAILQKGTRGSFHHWTQDDYELAVTMLQKPHAQGGFGLTPNVLPQISVIYVIPIPVIGWILTSRGTTTLASESNSSRP